MVLVPATQLQSQLKASLLLPWSPSWFGHTEEREYVIDGGKSRANEIVEPELEISQIVLCMLAADSMLCLIKLRRFCIAAGSRGCNWRYHS